MAIDIEKWRTAIRKNDSIAVRSFIEAGADVSAVIQDVTPLGLAAMFGSLDSAAILVEAGAAVNQAYGNQETPLIAAARGGFVELVDALLLLGADPRPTAGPQDRREMP